MSTREQVRVMSRSRFPDGFRILKGTQEYVTYIEHATIRLWYSDTPGDFETHFHSAVEIIMPIRGEVVYTVSDFSYSVQSDEVLIIPPNWSHSLSMGEGSARYLFLFEPDSLFSMRDMSLIAGLANIPIYLSEQPEAQETIRGLLMQIVNCYDKKEFLWNSMCYSYILQMYVRLGQLNMNRVLAKNNDQGRKTDVELMESARLYIDQNYMRDLTLDDLSAFTGFSRCYFSRMFKRQVGVSFSDYLRQKRVSMATDLLIHSRQPIQAISVNTGFGSVTTFNRVFREARNLTPSRYREIYGDFH